MKYKLKILHNDYVDIESGKKNFEIELNDRDYKVGDTLILREYNKCSNGFFQYTGREITRKIQYVYQGNGYGLSEKYCILGLEQESCKDTISRQATLEVLRKHHYRRYRDIDGDWVDGSYSESVYDEINELPPITPEPNGNEG